jgi:phosphonoacetaldehyde hydrolase
MNAESVKHHAALIPGVTNVVAALRERGYAIGSTTGYNRAIMDVVVPLAREQGFEPDNLVCAGDLVASRPSPLMMYRTFADLGVWPPASVIKVDDTAPGILEGIAAGTWTVGVVVSGNGVGLSLDDWNALDAATQQTHRQRAGEQLLAAGAHTLIDTVADLLPVVNRIERLIAEGSAPKPLE